MGPPPDPGVKVLPPAEALRLREDRAQELVDTTPRSILLLVYKVLFAQGVRITTIDSDIKKAMKEEDAGVGNS